MATNDIQIKIAQWPADSAAIQALRKQVFVIEQGICEALEWDGLDDQCTHLLATTSIHPVGTIRLQTDGHIGRMAVLKPYRQRGIGTALLSTLLQIAAQQGKQRVYLNAQSHAVSFYSQHGFIVQGPVFTEAGIAHQKMDYTIQTASKTVD